MRRSRWQWAPRAGVLMLVVCAAAACTAPPPHARVRRAIVGGTEAPLGAYPETVALMDLSYGDPVGYFCSGTLIAPNAVVSAAHCMFDYHDNRVPAADVGVFIGHDARAVPLSQVKRVIATFVPHSYPYGQVTDDTHGSGRDDDISLLVLADPVLDVVPAPILPAAEVTNLTQGTMLLMVGFGQTALDYSSPDGLMFFASSPVQLHSDYEIVIGAPGQPDTCYGDSGGPAFLDQGGTRTLVGITSRGTYDATLDCGEGTINTLAPAYLDWIANSLATIDGGVVQRDAGPQQDGGAAADAAPPLGDGGHDGSADDGDAGTGGASGGCAVSRRPTGATPAGLLLVLGGLLAARLRVPGRRRRRTRD